MVGWWGYPTIKADSQGRSASAGPKTSGGGRLKTPKGKNKKKDGKKGREANLQWFCYMALVQLQPLPNARTNEQPTLGKG